MTLALDTIACASALDYLRALPGGCAVSWYNYVNANEYHRALHGRRWRETGVYVRV